MKAIIRQKYREHLEKYGLLISLVLIPWDWYWTCEV